MFNLNDAISKWQAGMSGQPHFLASDLEELEDHLRQEVFHLGKLGLTEEEAFLVSSKRIGNAEDLDREFVIADPRRLYKNRLTWVATAGVIFVFMIAVSKILAYSGMALLIRNFTASNFPLDGLGLAWILISLRTAFLVWGGVLIWRELISNRQRKYFCTMKTRYFVLGGLLLLLVQMGSVMSSSFLLAHSGLERSAVGSIQYIDSLVKLIITAVFPSLLLFGVWKVAR